MSYLSHSQWHNGRIKFVRGTCLGSPPPPLSCYNSMVSRGRWSVIAGSVLVDIGFLPYRALCLKCHSRQRTPLFKEDRINPPSHVVRTDLFGVMYGCIY